LSAGIRLVAIGDELLDGPTRDTNSLEVASLLEELGLRARDRRTVRDREEDLRGEVLDLLAPDSPVDLVLSTGGLGPTLDDRTRSTLARAFGAELVFDEARWAELLAWFAARGRVPGALQRSQACHPQPGRSLPNPVGTANGLVFEREGKAWVALPGVPSECRHLLEHGVRDWLVERYGSRPRGRVLAFRSRRLPEADLALRLEPLSDFEALGEVGFYPQPDGVLFKLRLPAAPDLELDRRAKLAQEWVRERLGDFLLWESAEPAVELVFRRLAQRGLTLSLAESCTGGGLARELTERPGASAVFPGGVVVYSNESKQFLLGVPGDLLERHGAVSEACAGALAVGAKQRFRSDWALAVTGIAGPGGGTADKPVGTVWLGLAGPTNLKTRRLDLRGNREQIRARAAGQAWAWLLEVLEGDSTSTKDTRGTLEEGDEL
jgi:nicotinamide-nucleotide amidase